MACLFCIEIGELKILHLEEKQKYKIIGRN